MSATAKSFTAVGDGLELVAPVGATLGYAVTGTFVGTVLFEQLVRASWVTLVTASSVTRGTFTAESSESRRARYRFRCSAYTSGTIVTTLDTAPASASSGLAPRVALSGDNGADDLQARLPGDVTDHKWQLEVHLHQRLLHPLDMHRRELNHGVPVPHVGPERHDPRYSTGTTSAPVSARPRRPDAASILRPKQPGCSHRPQFLGR
jgi:hypothetical protein